MKSVVLAASLLVLFACRSENEDTLRRQVKDLTAELASARLELFSFRLSQARAQGKPDIEDKLLQEGLRSPSNAVRAQAIREVAALPPDRQKTFLDVDAIVALIGDPCREVRLAALEGAKAAGDARVLDAILAATGDADGAVVVKAIDILGARASSAAAGPILRILASTRDDSIRWSSINALGKIAAPESAEAIRPYLGAAQPTNLRDVAAQALGKLRDAQSIPALIEALAKDPEERVRAAAARALGRIGGTAPLRDDLVPAALNDPSAAVKQAAWEASVEAADKRLADLLFLAQAMLGNGRRTDVDAVCVRIRDLRPEGEEREQALKIEERAADADIAAQDFRAAVFHLDALRAARPSQAPLLRKLARCHRELTDHDAALKAIEEAMQSAGAGSPLYWELRLEQMAEFEALGAHARVIAEFANVQPPETAKAAIDAARARATAALIKELSSADAAARKRAVESVKPLGKNFIGALADAIGDASLRDREAVLEAGNAIAGTSFSDPTRAAEIAEAWRAWARR